MKKRLLLLLLWAPFFSHSQDRNEFWLKINLGHRFSERLSVSLDVQHRRQANYRTKDENIFHYPLANNMRIWVNYRLPHNWMLVLSPIGYFNNEDILNSNGELRLTNEWRVSPGIIKSFNIGKIKNSNRLLLDARFAGINSHDYFFQSRFRLQDSFTMPLFTLKKRSRFAWLLSNEVLLKKEKRSGGFDQNRLYNALQWENPHTGVDIGYQWVLQKGLNSSFRKDQLFIILNISI